jgi:hypothetical protein
MFVCFLHVSRIVLNGSEAVSVQVYQMVHKAGLEIYPPPPSGNSRSEMATDVSRSKQLIQHFFSLANALFVKVPEADVRLRRLLCSKDKSLPSARDFVLRLWPLIAAHMHELSEVLSHQAR